MNDEAAKKQVVIILNKANILGQLTPNNFEPFTKDPHIAPLVPYFYREIFTQIGHSEELGTGIPNIYKYTKPYSNNENIIFKEEDIFITEVPLKEFDNDTDNRLSKIISFIKRSNKISTKELSVLLAVSQITIKRDIEKLKKQKLLERLGKEKTGYWKII